MPDLDEVRTKLAWAARMMAQLKSSLLDEQKAYYADLERDDFLWHYLLQSFATMGRETGWGGLIGDEANYQQVRYETIQKLSAEERLDHTLVVCKKAGVRYANRKAMYIVGCFDRIEALGGPLAAKGCLFQQIGREAKIAFLKSFPGIGDKFARNLMMDVYHDDFRESIAIDSRIQAISDKWELAFNSYDEHESFYLSVAREAGLNGWEFDRLMFSFTTVFHPPISMD